MQDWLCMVMKTARKVVPALSLIVTVVLQNVWLCRFLIVTTCGFAEGMAIYVTHSQKMSPNFKFGNLRYLHVSNLQVLLVILILKSHFYSKTVWM